MSDKTPTVDAAPPEILQKTERREWVRYPSSLEVTCRLFGTPDDHGWPAELQNVSALGCRLITSCSFGRGAILEVRPQNRAWDLNHKLLVRVKNATLQSGGNWQLGCTFVRELSDEELMALL
jgi:hypothetical protein